MSNLPNKAIAVIAEHAHSKKNRAALLRHVCMIERGSQEGILEELDRKDVEMQYQVIVKALTQD